MNMFSSICSVTRGRAAVADEIGAELALAGAAERHVVAQDLELLAVLRRSIVSALCALVGLTASSSSMSDSFVRPMMRSCSSVGSAFQPVEIVQVFLHDHVAAAGERGILVADERGVDRRVPVRVLGAVDEAEQVAVVEVAEAVHLVDGGDGVAEPAMICAASSKHRSMRLARMWNSRSPGVAMAWRAPARNSRNGCSSAGRGWPNRRSQASEPMPMTQDSPAFEIAKAHRAQQPGEIRAERPHVARFARPGLMVTTRKIAARVSGADTACGMAATGSGVACVVIGIVSWQARKVEPPSMDNPNQCVTPRKGQGCSPPT